MKTVINNVLPPFIYKSLKTVWKSHFQSDANPIWNQVVGGELKDCELFLDSSAGEWQKEMIQGTFDKFIYDYISKMNLKGKAIYEIGAHVGYHALGFARITGEQGSVIAFEPNKFNRDRLNSHLDRNKKIVSNIKVYDYALSDSTGSIEFVLSKKIEDGTSSGSHIGGISTPLTEAQYSDLGFEKARVPMISIDQLIEKDNLPGPSFMKIDVEGAESLVLTGANKTIKQYKPTILLEVHSILNMFNVQEILGSLNYKLTLLQEEDDGRCFVAAEVNN